MQHLRYLKKETALLGPSRICPGHKRLYPRLLHLVEAYIHRGYRLHHLCHRYFRHLPVGAMAAEEEGVEAEVVEGAAEEEGRRRPGLVYIRLYWQPYQTRNVPILDGRRLCAVFYKGNSVLPTFPSSSHIYCRRVDTYTFRIEESAL